MIELVDVSVVLGSKTLVHQLSLHVPEGTWTCIVGPNGAGKTSLLRALTGGVPSHGTIRLAGQDIAGLKPRQRARLVAAVPQTPTIPPGTSVEDYVLLGRTAHISWLGREAPNDLGMVRELLDRLALTQLSQRDLSTLSGGERQRAVIARGLAQEAPILVLDEPNTGLDLGHQQQVLGLVERLRDDHGLTVISAMHDLTLAAQHADHFVLLDQGRIAAGGTAAEVFQAETLARVFGATVSVLEDHGDLIVVPRAM